MSNSPKLQPLQTEKQVWELLAQALPVLKALHERGQVHGDINPASVVLQSPAQPLELLNLQGLGSPEYMAPEQLQGTAIAASDLYSLGVTCIYGLTGISPFEWLDSPILWTDYLPHPLSPSLQNLLTRLTASAVGDRYQTVEEVFHAMREAGAAVPAKHTPPQLSEQWCCVKVSESFNSVVTSILIQPDGWIASGSEDGHIQRWNWVTGELGRPIKAHQKGIAGLACHPGSTLMASSSDDHTVQIWDAEHSATLIGHTHCVKAIAFSPDGSILASGSWDKTIKLWQVQAKCLSATLVGHRLGINSLAFHPHEKYLASGGLDSEVILWNWKSQELLQRLDGHNRAVTALAFSPDGQWLASGSADGTIHLWKYALQRFELKKIVSAHSWTVSSLIFNPTNNYLFSASWDHTIKVWNIPSAQAVETLKGHTDSVTVIALAETGQVLVSGSCDHMIRVWQFKELVE